GVGPKGLRHGAQRPGYRRHGCPVEHDAGYTPRRPRGRRRLHARPDLVRRAGRARQRPGDRQRRRRPVRAAHGDHEGRRPALREADDPQRPAVPVRRQRQDRSRAVHLLHHSRLNQPGQSCDVRSSTATGCCRHLGRSAGGQWRRGRSDYSVRPGLARPGLRSAATGRCPSPGSSPLAGAALPSRMSQEGKENEMDTPLVVAPEEWLAARKDLLATEKEVTHAMDAVDAARRELPMTEVTQDYTFSGPGGPVSLAGLFAGRGQLITYHFMWRHAESGFPGEDQGCPTCSFLVDSIGDPSHLHARDTTLVLVSRAPYPSIERFRTRMGWQLPWYSSAGSDFNYDFHVSFDEARAPLEYNYMDQETLQRKAPTSGPAPTAPGSASSCARVTGCSTPIRPTSAAWMRCSAPTGGWT